MSKEILFDVQAREKIMQGVNILADSVKVTLGPSGKNVMIANGTSAPTGAHGIDGDLGGMHGHLGAAAGFTGDGLDLPT